MQKVFNVDGRIFSTLSKVFDLLILNILFLISCVPIVTIGASLTALYSVTLKMVRNEELFVAREFRSSFISNLKQSSIIWVAALLFFAALISIGHFVVPVNSLILFPLLLLATIILLSFMYVFPMIAKFKNSSFHILKNALFICLHSTAYSILLFIMTLFFLVVIPIYIPKLLFIWLFLGFSVSAFLKSFLLEKVFNTYVKKQH
ncbi:YesL family protein [Falsibacillus albus]|uniref:DUF624 domain-containing protein n=1 Tax=Falsibacillus albus TaxID=2478915 RepID=A0A3L7JUV4_9BACI|nr:YesL family protein [Falsibacillus albus]RLQ94024.1 DUF624 domain-containing protein [Falsibacillus albus]